MRKDTQLKSDKNWKGHVAQWKERLADARADVGSKLLRESHHAHRYLKDQEYRKENKKEKQAYSLEKATLRRTSISHEFESVAEFNQNPQHDNYNNHNYLKLSVNKLIK